MNSSLFLPLIGVLFLGIGCFTIIVARKRLRHARALGQPEIWYKNLGLLTGLEYTLLGIIVFLNLSGPSIPAPFRATFDIFYAVILLLAIVFLLAVVFLGFKKPRQKRLAPQAVANIAVDADTQSPDERAAEAQRKRERRQKAAAARRRRAGRA